MDAQAIQERLEKLTYRQIQQEAKKNGVKAKGTREKLLKNIIEKLALEPFDSSFSSSAADTTGQTLDLPENEQVNSTAIVAADSTIQVLDKADDETTMASTSAAMNESVSPENEEVDATLSKPIFHRRESLPTFLSINPTTIAASANAEGKPRRNSIDVVRSQKSLQIKKYSTKSNDFLNINDKENDKLENCYIIVEEEDENELSLIKNIAGWQAYITNLLDNSEGIKRAAIVGTDGAVWAKSEGENEFRATEAELRSFVSNFNNLNDVHAKGADLEGVHYIVPLTDKNLIIGEKDKSGFCAVKTNTAVIIAVFEGETSACTEAIINVITLETYLLQTGY